MWGESQGKGWADATSRPPPQPSERVPHQAAPNTRLQCPRPGSSRWLPSSATEPDATATGGLSNNQITKYQLSPVRSMLIQLPWAVRTSSHPTAGLIKKTGGAAPNAACPMSQLQEEQNLFTFSFGRHKQGTSHVTSSLS